MTGTVTGTDPGDAVEVWFEARGGRVQSPSFTYRAVSETGNRVLVVAAEDYTGSAPAPSRGPRYLQSYLDALRANGIAADVYDVDAQDRVAPDPLGVLGHYDAVVWYTGDDLVTRPRGRRSPNADRLAMDEILAFRAYMNAGGRVLYTGKAAGEQYGDRPGRPALRPEERRPVSRIRASTTGGACRCSARRSAATRSTTCSSTGSACARRSRATATTRPRARTSRPRAWTCPSWRCPSPSGRRPARRTRTRARPSSPRAAALPADRFPQFRSWPSSRWSEAGGHLRPAHRRALPLLPDGRRGLQAAHAGGGGAGGRPGHPELLGVLRHGAAVGPRDRRGEDRRAPTTGRRCRTPTATRRRTQARAARADGRSCTRSSRTTRPWSTRAPARRWARPARGTRRRGSRAAGSHSPSTCRAGPVRRSRCRSPTSPTSRRRASACCWTTSRCRTGRRRRSRTNLGGWRVAGPPPGSRPNPNDWIPATAGSYPSAPRSRRPTRSSSASGSRASRRRRTARS